MPVTVAAGGVMLAAALFAAFVLRGGRPVTEDAPEEVSEPV